MNAPINLEEFATVLRGWSRFACSRPDGRGPRAGLETAFNRLAVSLFRLQFTHDAAYRRLCETRKVTPRGAAHWSQIPSVPASAFKEMALSCLPINDRTTVFQSSGTTGQQPSRHFHNAA